MYKGHKKAGASDSVRVCLCVCVQSGVYCVAALYMEKGTRAKAAIKAGRWIISKRERMERQETSHRARDRRLIGT